MKILRLIKKIKNNYTLRDVVRIIKSLLNPSNKSHVKIRKELEQKDKQNALERKELLPLHEKLDKLKQAQLDKWNSLVYCAGYFYQGYNRIGISGIKPTEDRIKKYEIERYLLNTKTVLDIGSNSGFLACYISEFVKEVDAIELNPFLVEMGKETASFLNFININFIQGDFIEYNFDKKYDIIFSLSNHFTIDGNLNIGFESYIRKIFDVLNNDGMMFFESHNINGDDKDMDLKFQIASKFFTLVDYKMVSAFYPTDIDKLFAVFKRLDKPGLPQKINFKLNEAKNKYQY